MRLSLELWLSKRVVESNMLVIAPVLCMPCSHIKVSRLLYVMCSTDLSTYLK